MADEAQPQRHDDTDLTFTPLQLVVLLGLCAFISFGTALIAAAFGN